MIAQQLFKATSLLTKTQSVASLNKFASYSFASTKFSDKISNMRQQSKPIMDVDQGSAGAALITNAGLNAFITRVYKASGAGILTALGTSQFAIAAGLPFTSPLGCGIGGLVLGLGGMFGVMKTQASQFSEVIDGNTHLKTVNTPLRIGLFGLGMAGLGLSASPLFAMVSMQNPAILPTAIGISTGLFGAASFYAYSRPKDSLMSWGQSLYGALFGLIGINIVGALTQVVIGPNMFSTCLHRFDTFAGVGLFSALIAYDTHCAIKSYEDGNADHLMISLDFALDFWNILVRVTQILQMFSSND